MPTPLLSILLLLALATWWQQRQSQAEPVITLCGHCGDLVQHVPGLPYRCPSCSCWAWSW